MKLRSGKRIVDVGLSPALYERLKADAVEEMVLNDESIANVSRKAAEIIALYYEAVDEATAAARNNKNASKRPATTKKTVARVRKI